MLFSRAATGELPARVARTHRVSYRSMLLLPLRIVRATAVILLVAVIAVAGLALTSRVVSGGNELEVLGHPVLVMTTGSMEPTIPVGSLVMLDKVSDSRSRSLRVGDIVTFHPKVGRPDELVTHRIQAVNVSPAGVTYTTKGDANQSEDLTQLEPSRVVGLYAGHVPRAGRMINGFSQWRVVALIALSLLLAQFALEQRPLRGIQHKKEVDQS